MTGEEAKLFQSFQTVIRQAKSFEESLDKSGQAAKRLSSEERAMAREAKRAFEEARTPLEKYNQSKQTLDGLLKKGKVSQDEYNAALRQAKQNMDQAGQSGEKAFGAQALGMAKQFAGALGLTGGIAGGVAVIRKGWEDVIEAQNKSLAMTLALANPQEAALTNLGATSEAERDKFLVSVRDMATKVQVSEKEVFLRATDALSARGEKPVYGPGGAMDAVRASFGFSRGDPAAGKAAAGAALDLSAITGGTAEQSLGLLKLIAVKSRVTDPRAMAEALPPAMKAATATGATPSEAGALFAALTQGMADPTGKTASTSAISFAMQLRDRYEKELDDAAKLVAKFKMPTEQYEALEQRAARWKGLSMSDRLKELQADPTAQQTFLASTSFEKRAQVPVEELISGGAAARAFTQFRDELPGLQASGEFFTKSSRVLRGAPAQRIADASRGMEGLLERAAAARPMEEQFLSKVREQMPEIMQQAGYTGAGGWMSRKAASMGAWVSGDTLWDYEREVWASMGPFDPKSGTRRNEPGAAQNYEVLREFRDTIREMQELVRKQNDVADKQLRATDAGPALVAPGEDR